VTACLLSIIEKGSYELMTNRPQTGNNVAGVSTGLASCRYGRFPIGHLRNNKGYTRLPNAQRGAVVVNLTWRAQ
jgi:hypothetical protein